MAKSIAARGSRDERAELRWALVAAEVPEEYIRALDEGQDLHTVMHSMIEAGILPDAGSLLDNLFEEWAPLLHRRMDPMSAEMMGVELAAAVRAAADGDDDDDDAMLYEKLIDRAEQRGDAISLAALRVVAATGPEKVRPAAALAAGRIAAGGAKDPKWVAGLGAPSFAGAFGYRDPHGAQEAIAIVYAYGKRQHAFVVLIDHDLGGGIKDVWPTDDPKEVRAQYRLATRMTGMELRTYDAAQARAIVEAALARPTCAVQEDQIDSVDSYLDLLRRRVELLPRPEGGRSGVVAAAPLRPRVASGRKTGVHRLKVTLHGAKPPIWRRLEVPSDITLSRLHAVLQEAFGWQNTHLWAFDTGSGVYGLPDRELGHRSAGRVKLETVAPRPGARLMYVYDFGDDWQHDIAVEDVSAPESGVAYPRCLTGRRAAPPDDCGGAYGYADLLAVLADPTRVEHQNLLDWLNLKSAADFDPAHFDVTEVNEALGPFRTVLVQH